IKRIAIPLIGAGIGGLDPVAVVSIANQVFKEIDVVVVVYHKDTLAFETLITKWDNFSFPTVIDGVVFKSKDGKWMRRKDGQAVPTEIAMTGGGYQINHATGDRVCYISTDDPHVYNLLVDGEQ
ncbi:MAG: hypothetical protein ACRC8G_01975, partial [Plesiomonas shigelloides]